MKGPLICKALIAQPFFIRNPTLDRVWQGGFVGESAAQAGERGAGFLQDDPPTLRASPACPSVLATPSTQAAQRAWLRPASVVTMIRLLDDLTRSVCTSWC